jgi:hypothetical protein
LALLFRLAYRAAATVPTAAETGCGLHRLLKQDF